MFRIFKKNNILGSTESLQLVDFGNIVLDARVDTGAQTTSIHAHKIKVVDGVLQVSIAHRGRPKRYEEHAFTSYEEVVIKSSTGHKVKRFKVATRVAIRGRQLVTYVTFSKRDTQMYPVLIGRSLLESGFIVDVSAGNRHVDDNEELKKDRKGANV